MPRCHLRWVTATLLWAAAARAEPPESPAAVAQTRRESDAAAELQSLDGAAAAGGDDLPVAAPLDAEGDDSAREPADDDREGVAPEERAAGEVIADENPAGEPPSAGGPGAADRDSAEKERPWPSVPAAPLPPARVPPDIAPILAEHEEHAPRASAITREDRPRVAIGTLLGLLGLLALSYLGGHPRVQALERKLGVSQVITAGFPFVLLGMLGRSTPLRVVNHATLTDLSLLLRIGLGCIGFVAGFRFSAQFRAGTGAEIARVAALATALPFALVAAISGAVLLAFSEVTLAEAVRDPVFVRDALILGTAGAMSARTSADVFRADDSERVLARVLRLEELAGIVGLAVVTAYFRPKLDVSWHLPGAAWLLLTIGLGATLGLIAYVSFKRPQEGPEFVVLTLGSISFGAGVAGYLRLSPVVVSFIAGTCLALLPVEHKDRIRVALRRLERPIYLLSLIVIGALWQVDDWVGWLLVPVFTGARFLGKWLATRLGTGSSGLALSLEERQVLALSPMGPLAIAIVVNAQLLYPGGSIAHIVAAVIGGAISTEIVVQLASRRMSPSPSGQSRPDLPPAMFSDPPERMP